MSEDPKLFDAGDYNLFRYCHNDPVDFTDPMGLDDGMWARTQERMEAYSKAKNDDSYNFIMGLMQRQFSSAISAGMAGYSTSQFFSAVANFIQSARPDAAKVSSKDIGRVLVADAREAARKTFGSIQRDRYGRQRSTETAFAEYASGTSLHREGPGPAGTDPTGRPIAYIPGLTKDHAPITVSHAHGPESIPTFTGRDIPNARGGNLSGKPFISSLGVTGDRGNVIQIFIPAGTGGQFFHSTDGLNFEHGL